MTMMREHDNSNRGLFIAGALVGAAGTLSAVWYHYGRWVGLEEKRRELEETRAALVQTQGAYRNAKEENQGLRTINRDFMGNWGEATLKFEREKADLEGKLAQAGRDLVAAQAAAEARLEGERAHRRSQMEQTNNIGAALGAAVRRQVEAEKEGSRAAAEGEGRG